MCPPTALPQGVGMKWVVGFGGGGEGGGARRGTVLYKSFFKGVVWEPNLEFLQKNIFSYMVSPLDFLEFFHLCVS